MRHRLQAAPVWIGLVVMATSLISAWGQTPAVASNPASVTRVVGTVKNIAANSLTINSDAGPEVTATMGVSTKILRVPPGEKDLKNATPLQAQDLQVGDRVLVRGQASTDEHALTALSVIVMKQADVSAKQEHEREDWQKRGVGGLVSAVDAAAGTITISVNGIGASHSVTVHAGKETIARRYAPGSVKFDDARPAPIDQIRPGDQLRARGTRSADGNEITAEEIVSGTFRNIAGTVTTVDPTANTLTVQDAIMKAPVVVKVSGDSQIKKLPAEMAQRIASRLKGGSQDGQEQGAGSWQGRARQGERPAGPGGEFQRPGGAGGPPDLQRFLNRLPSVALSELQKGDAVMIVTTEASGTVTAITMLAGVEPILTTSSARKAAMMLSPWTLGGGSAGEGESAP